MLWWFKTSDARESRLICKVNIQTFKLIGKTLIDKDLNTLANRVIYF